MAWLAYAAAFVIFWLYIPSITWLAYAVPVVIFWFYIPSITWLAYVAPVVVLWLYIIRNDRTLAKHPKAVALSPRRWSTDDIDKLAISNVHETELELPPKTGRRYIITGGVRMRKRCMGSLTFEVDRICWRSSRS